MSETTGSRDPVAAVRVVSSALVEDDLDRSVIGPPGASHPVAHGSEGESPSPEARGGKKAAQLIKTWAASRATGSPQAKLAAMAPGAAPGTVQTPFPRVMTREDYVKAVKGSGIPALAAKAKPEPVALDQLSAFQGTVNAERVDQYLQNPGQIPKGKKAVHSGMPVDYPVVVRLGGRTIIHDGNHRAVAAKLRGDATIKARVVDLDARKGGA